MDYIIYIYIYNYMGCKSFTYWTASTEKGHPNRKQRVA